MFHTHCLGCSACDFASPTLVFFRPTSNGSVWNLIVKEVINKKIWIKKTPFKYGKFSYLKS